MKTTFSAPQTKGRNLMRVDGGGWTRLDLVGLGWTSEGRVLGAGGNGMVE